MTPIPEMLALALQYHQSGALAQAEELYRQILQANPDHADAHHMLGVLASQTGRTDLAIASIRQALILNPLAADYHSNLGLAYQAVGQLEEAVTHYQEALRIWPDFPEALTCLGNALHQQGKLEEAVAQCRKALGVRPDYPAAHVNMGSALLDQGKTEEAVACFQHALRIDPNLAEAHNNLGTAFTRQDKFPEASNCFREALRLRPNYAQAHYNLATVHQAEGQLDEALDCYEYALSCDAGFAPAHYNVATVHQTEGQLDEALDSYKHALDCDAGFAEAHFNRALLWLLQGKWAQGWAEYEWRWARNNLTRRHFPQPLWDGSDLAGRTILLYAEQGLGDTLQFIRYLPLVKERGGKAILECQPTLLPLLAGFQGSDLLLAQGSALPAFDAQAPLLSLPGIFHTTLASIPAPVPYLDADAGLVEHWKSRKSEVGSRKSEHLHLTSDIRHRTSDFLVGIAWQGEPGFRNDRQRSIPLARFAPLARVEGVQLISLQKGPGAEQLPALARQFPVLDLGSGLDEASGAFMDTAAVMKNVNLVISSDTAVPHLAGALGVPVWVALPLVPDWRWLLRREDSPWYPNMRLFRQTRYGNWEDVFERMAKELKAVVVSC